MVAYTRIVHWCTGIGHSLWPCRPIYTLYPPPVLRDVLFLALLPCHSIPGALFWHFGQEGDSWAYLWATLALWLLSILGRVFYHNQSFKPDNQWLTGFPTRLRALPDSMTRIDILVPSKFSSVPGMDIATTGTAVTVRHVAMEFFVTGHPSTGGKKLPLETS